MIQATRRDRKEGARVIRFVRSLFGIRGRVGRRTFWLSHLFVAATVIVVMMGLIATTFTGVGSPSGKVDPEALPRFVAGLVSIPIAMVVLFILALTIRICVDTRRLHDRGKSGWLLVPMMGPSMVWTLTHGPSLKVAIVLWLISGTNLVTVVMFLAMLGTSIWYWIELGFRRGDAGDNEYGPPPLGPSGVLPEKSLWSNAGGNLAASLAKPPVSWRSSSNTFRLCVSCG